MGNAGMIQEMAAPVRAGSAVLIGRCEESADLGKAAFRNTLHCSSHVVGSAAQFNQSVSAMPEDNSSNSHALVPSTADTLLKG